MNAEHQALAEYLEAHIDNRLKAQSKDLFTYMDERFDYAEKEFKSEFKEIHRQINSQIEFVDRKNSSQDEQIDDHELRISALESDYRMLTS